MQKPPSERLLRHFRGVVVPTVEEYLAPRHLDSVRHGYQAAIVLSHMADHYFVACYGGFYRPVRLREEIAKFRAKLAKKDRDFELLADVCDASKHAELTSEVGGKHAERTRLFTSSERIRSGVLTVDSTEWTADSTTLTIDMERVLFVYLDGGTRRELFPAVERVLAFWRGQLSETARVG